jgi:VWFA-related protein
MRPLLVVAAIAAEFFGGAAPAQAQAPESAQPAFRTGTGEVLVDIVVRDKRGKLTRDLKAEEISILENGIAQKVTSFRQQRTARPEREDREPTVQAGGAAGHSVEVTRQIRLVSLVFEGLDSDGRRNARNAAQTFVANDIGPNVYYAVFYVSRTFRPVLAYTNNHELIKSAIDRVTGWDKAPTGNSSGIAAARADASGGSTSDAAARGPNFEATVAAMSDFNNRMELNMFGATPVQISIQPPA